MMGTYPKFEEFQEIYKFIRRYDVRKGMDGSLRAENPKTGVRYESHLAKSAIFEVRKTPNGIVRRNILSKPVDMKSSSVFAWTLFCKLKQRGELFWNSS